MCLIHRYKLRWRSNTCVPILHTLFLIFILNKQSSIEAPALSLSFISLPLLSGDNCFHESIFSCHATFILHQLNICQPYMLIWKPLKIM